jgi:histidinol phosphatase-like PHP family hydrolase
MKPIDRDLHVHTNLSRCGKSEATVENCLAAAEKQGIKTIGFANHCWAAEMPNESPWYRGQNIEHVLSIRDQLPNDTRGFRILIGCETEYIGNGIAGLNKELARHFDFVWVPANHFHQKGFVVPEELGSGGPKEVSELLYRRFMETVDLGFADGIVHPFIPLGFLEWEAEILDLITDTMYEDCFKAAVSAGIAVEINAYNGNCKTRTAPNGFSSLYLKIHTIARECGCKFFFGSDAHHPDAIGGYERMAAFAESCGIDDSSLWDGCGYGLPR